MYRIGSDGCSSLPRRHAAVGENNDGIRQWLVISATFAVNVYLLIRDRSGVPLVPMLITWNVLRWTEENLITCGVIPLSGCAVIVLLLFFSFNNIEEDHEFLASINNIDTLGLMDDDLIFHPFEINDYDHRSPLCEIDPDLYFYNSVDFRDAIQCNHYDEKTFCEADFQRGNNQTGGVFSICHLNIRSMKHNLKNFDVYMKTLDYNFSLIGLSETWLQNQTCDLYDLERYLFLETHRTTKSGGGDGLFINEKYQF